jgi:hypothetical protein
MKAKLFFLYFFSGLLIIFGLMMIFGSIIKITRPDPKYSLEANIAGMVIAGFIPLAAGLYLLLTTLKKNRTAEKDELENTILKLAKANKGKLTAGEVAMSTSLGMEDAKKYLDSLCIKGIVDLFISESGINVYQFKMIIPENEKEEAERL